MAPEADAADAANGRKEPVIESAYRARIEDLEAQLEQARKAKESACSQADHFLAERLRAEETMRTQLRIAADNMDRLVRAFEMYADREWSEDTPDGVVWHTPLDLDADEQQALDEARDHVYLMREMIKEPRRTP